MNRCEFLYTGAAAATVATRGVDARAYSAIAGANDRVGLGVIGTGRRATEVCRAFAQNVAIHVAGSVRRGALLSRTGRRGRAAGRELRVVRAGRTLDSAGCTISRLGRKTEHS